MRRRIRSRWLTAPISRPAVPRAVCAVLLRRGEDGTALNTSHSGGETEPPGTLGGGSLVLRVHRPHPDIVLVSASGAIDESTGARLERLLSARLDDAVRTVVLDLTGVGFLAVSALQLLARTAERARERSVELALVATGHEVLRALHIAGLPEVLPVHASARAAVREPDDRTDPA